MIEPGEVEQREAQHGVPRKGVADAAVERVRFVLVEAQDVGRGLGAGKAAAEGGDAGADQDQRQPGEIAAAEAVGEAAKK